MPALTSQPQFRFRTPPRDVTHERRSSRACVALPAPQRRWDLLKRYGSFSLAYSATVQDGLSYLGDETGFVAYATQWGFDMVLGDPVVGPADRERLLADVLARPHKPCFVHIERGTAAVLARRGYLVNQMGVERRLALHTYDFQGKEKESLRYASNWLRRRGYVIEEDTALECRSEIGALSRRWIATRPVKHREAGFLNRPLRLEREPDVRRFLLRNARGELKSFVFFDPIYRDGAVVGYSAAFKRREPGTSGHAEQGIIKTAIEVFRDEGIGEVRLGLSPLEEMSDRSFRRNRLLHWSWCYAARSNWVNRRLYNLGGHAQYKRKFRGVTQPIYFAAPVVFSQLRVLALLRLMGVL